MSYVQINIYLSKQLSLLKGYVQPQVYWQY